MKKLPAVFLGPPTRPDADIDYTFAQILVTESRVDYSGNCGNMSSAACRLFEG